MSPGSLQFQHVEELWLPQQLRRLLTTSPPVSHRPKCWNKRAVWVTLQFDFGALQTQFQVIISSSHFRTLCQSSCF